MATRKVASKKAVRKKAAKSVADTSLQYLLFNASDRRSDHWNELNLIGGKLNSAGVSKQAAGELHAKADALLTQMAALEGYWAFPGKALFGAAVDALQDADYGHFQHVVARISKALKNESYRRSSDAWDLNSDGRRYPQYPGLPQSARQQSPLFRSTGGCRQYQARNTWNGFARKFVRCAGRKTHSSTSSFLCRISRTR